MEHDDERSLRYRFLTPALKYESQLRACLINHTRDRSVVSDLLQDTWVRLLKAGQSERPFVGSFQAYALQTARNVAIDWLRRRKVVTILRVEDCEALDFMVDAKPQPDQIVNGRQELERLVRVAGKMPLRQRQVFALRRVYELTQQEIAIRLRISQNTVERRMHMAAQWLAKHVTAPDTSPSQRSVGSRAPQAMSGAASCSG